MTDYVSKLGNTLLNAPTLVALLRYRAISQPNQTAYTFLVNGEAEEVSISYQELDQRAKAIAAYLQSGNSEGDRALLLYQPGLEYIAAFFGCLYAGVIAVPAYPSRSNKPTPRLQAIVADAQAKIALTTTSILMNVEAQFAHSPDLAALHWITTDTITDHLFEQWQQPLINHETLAFVQYTSGSTGTPKGVMLTHGNLLYNLDLIHQCFEHSPQSRGVIWLPPYHDMGLIGGIIQPLYGGFPVTLMAPISFLQSPFRWLEAISRYKATTSGGPNFAYDLCVRRITPEQRASLDLSSWDVAFNGAEPIRHETLEEFAATFAPCGFRKEAFYPCYGLAETTLIVSGGKKAAPPIVQGFQGAGIAENRVIALDHTDNQDSQILTSSGQIPPNQQTVIVNPESLTQCLPDQIGEIWVASPSVAQGYWNQTEQTKQTFQAYLADTNQGPFLRTGDLGFLHDGELFVTGRLKDLIVIRGRNHYPQDIELTVESSHPAIRASCGAAFSVDVNGEERLVVVYELERQYRHGNVDEIVSAIRQAVAENHELQVYAMVLVKIGSIPKTSSGKIQRHACRASFLNGSLNIIGDSILEANYTTGSTSETLSREVLLAIQPESHQSVLISYLRDQVAQVLKLAPTELDAYKSLSTLGLDSLMAIELKNDIETDLGVVLPMSSFLQTPSIEQLAIAVLTQLNTDVSSTPLIPIKSAESQHPLSYNQRSLWLQHQLAPTSPAYNIANAVSLKTEVDVAALQRAFQKLVDRHPSLRTTFHTSDKEPVQYIHEHQSVSFHLEDISTWSETSFQSRLIEAAHQPFNLEQGSLLRINLYTRSSQEHILLLVIHHIVADFWSLAVFAQELGVLYQGETSGVSNNLLPLLLQYTDYAYWQTQMLTSPEGERLWKYWQQQLSGDLPVLNLPTTKPRPRVQTYRGATLPFKLNADLVQQLKAISRNHEATLYMSLLAVFQIFLHHYTGQEDILVGSPTAGRSSSEVVGIMGYFVNPIVLRANLTGNPTYTEFLAQLRQTVLDAFAHQDYPLALLVERLQPVRDTSRSPLFQTMFVLHKAHLLHEQGLTSFALGETGAQLNLGGLHIEPFALEQQIAQFDLTLTMAEIGGELAASFEYNADLFESATISQMAEHFQTLIASIVTNPQEQVSRLPLLTANEQQKLLIEWNATQTDYPQDVCIHDLFELQVERTPEAIALIFQDEQLTYQELNNRANQLAHYLQSLGVGTETLVGICVERSLSMIMGILGILKTGAAYVPLDPAYPQERLAFMLADTQIEILLTQNSLISNLSAYPVKVIALDSDWKSMTHQSINNPVLSVTANNLAYIIYTSGSTGQPKGVMIPHRGIVNRLLWGIERYQLTPGDRILQKTSFSFDVSVWEIFGALLSGACLVIAHPGGHQDPKYLVELMAQQQITVVDFVPAMLQLILAEASLQNCSQLRCVTCGSEALARELRDRFFDHLPAVELHNCYGPTEVSIDATSWECARHSPTIAIGRPIANQEVYVLNRHLQPVPVGIAGELYVGGAGLARGYLNRPDLTSEKFIPHPFRTDARLYKTGDLARYLSDGNIEFLGRIDNQVKIRGLRVELEEISSVLRRYPDIEDVVVVVRDEAQNHRLVAYLVPQNSAHSHQQLTTTAIRTYLSRHLPDYMIPTALVILSKLPRNPNGKLDYRELPTPDFEQMESFVPPRNAVEETLVTIWKEILQVERVGIHDNFFELGGHSLLAIQVISHIRDIFRIDLSPQNLFEATTVTKLSEVVVAHEAKPGQVEKIAQLLKEIQAMSVEDLNDKLQQKKTTNTKAS